MALTEALKWRYATKKMNSETVPQELVDKISEAAHLAPTCSGLQPFRIIQISNKELKEKIKPGYRWLTFIGVCRLGYLHSGTNRSVYSAHTSYKFTSAFSLQAGYSRRI